MTWTKSAIPKAKATEPAPSGSEPSTSSRVPSKTVFKEIEPNFYRARLAAVKQGTGAYGPYLQFIFTVAEGHLKGYRFSGFAKPTFLKYGKLYRWVTNILGVEPTDFSPETLIGKECLVFLENKNDRYYLVTTVHPQLPLSSNPPTPVNIVKKA
jgi:hypothetical protein